MGAWGGASSIGNLGVQVEIQTKLYNVSDGQDDAFWVGDVLSDGSFVQFGYLILPTGQYCFSAHISQSGTDCTGTSGSIESSDARWFWAYFPNAEAVNNWYYSFGPADSAGYNSTWHLYTISPDASGDWSFIMDGVTVYSSSFSSSASTAPVHFVAEKASGPYFSQLGPVEFRNLAYLGNDSLWHATSSLSLIDGCDAADNDQCSISNAYGVEMVGPNDVIAGSIPNSVSESGQLIWERQSTCTLGTELLVVGKIGNAPLNVSFIDAVSSPQGSFRTDWWFGDGFHETGNSSQTFVYNAPGNYTPLVRVLDSTGCLSEASGEVSVAASNNPTFGTDTTPVTSFEIVFSLGVVLPWEPYAPNE